MSNEEVKADEATNRDAGRLIAFGLAAAEVAAILSFLSLESLDALLRLALYCFCFSTPALVAAGLAFHPSAKVEVESIEGGLFFYLYVAGGFVSAVGFGGVLFHFGWSFGAVYIAGVVLGFAAFAAAAEPPRGRDAQT